MKLFTHTNTLNLNSYNKFLKYTKKWICVYKYALYHAALDVSLYTHIFLHVFYVSHAEVQPNLWPPGWYEFYNIGLTIRSNFIVHKLRTTKIDFSSSSGSMVYIYARMTVKENESRISHIWVRYSVIVNDEYLYVYIRTLLAHHKYYLYTLKIKKFKIFKIYAMLTDHIPLFSLGVQRLW